MLHYAFKTAEVLQAITPHDRRTLLDALNLHESDALPTRTINDEMTPPKSGDGSPTKGRSVVTANNSPIGVLPEIIELHASEQLVALARQVAAPKRAEERAVARRAMPTFAANSIRIAALDGAPLDDLIEATTAVVPAAAPPQMRGGSLRGGSARPSGTRGIAPSSTRKLRLHGSADGPSAIY